MSIIGINSYSQSTLRDRLYNREYRTFTLDHWIVHDLYKNKEENGLLKNEVRAYYSFSDSLKAEITVLGEYISSLEETVDKKNASIASFRNEIKLTNDLYNNALNKLSASEKLANERKKEIIELKRKGVFEKILSFGWGPFRLKYIVPFATGYYLASNI